ncbi:50S ribosomal protein L9 [Candidatus Peregrinibacteria bacterium]|nr:MAG: 50S ribosomal protein L9 [Candidatus Peregrinibacteria bacterium]
MNIVLTQDVRHVGYAGEIVSVAAGYARNFLIPKGFAAIANIKDVRHAEEIRKNRVRKHEEVLMNIEKITEELKNAEITLTGKTSSGGKLFGGIGESDIAEAIKEQKKIEIDKRFISFPNGHIKTTGSHEVKILLGAGKEIPINITVKAE